MTTRFLSSLQVKRICLLLFALASQCDRVLAAENGLQQPDFLAGRTVSKVWMEISDAGPIADGRSQGLDDKLRKTSVDGALSTEGKRVPDDAFSEVAETQGSAECSAPAARGFAHRRYHWNASGLLHKPFYFEDVSLERYGQTHVLQPAVSGLKFFASVPFLPYKIGVDHPHRCIYTLGYQRPGNCACPVKERPVLSLRGGIVQAAAATGFVFLFP